MKPERILKDSFHMRTIKAIAEHQADVAVDWIRRAAKQESRRNRELSDLCDENVYRAACKAGEFGRAYLMRGN